MTDKYLVHRISSRARQVHYAAGLPGMVDGIRPTPGTVEGYLAYVRQVVVQCHREPPTEVLAQIRERYGRGAVVQW